MKTIQVNKIKIRICDSPERILCLYFDEPSLNNIQDCKIRYYDASIRKWARVSGREFITLIKTTGSWGFTHNNIIYIWYDGKPDTKELALLLAHEYGHTKKPYREYGVEEEKKAYTYEQCGKFVEKVMRKLGYVWKKNKTT